MGSSCPRAGWWFATAWVATLGCVQAEPFHCQEDADCVSSIGRGRCEVATSYCSYDDDRCASHRRYSPLAGPLAGACVASGDEASSSATVAEGTSDDDPSDDGSGETIASEESGEPLPSDGRLVWSRLVAHNAGGSDRFLAVALADDVVVAAGAQHSDLSFVALDPDTGDVLVATTHNAGGTDDAVHALVRGAGGEFYACGRADDVVLGRQSWIGTMDAALAGPPIISMVWMDHACHVVAELDAGRMIAAGDGVPIVPGSEFAWVYPFERSNPTLGYKTTSSGDGSGWNAAARVGGELLLGGRLGTSDGSQSGRGVVAGLDVEDIPSRIAVFSNALWSVQGLARSDDGFVLGGFESTDGAPAAWVGAHAAEGDEQWSWRPGHVDAAASRIEDVAVDSQGFTLAVGSVTAGADQKRWIVRLDHEGAPIWSYALPNEMAGGHDIASAVVILPNDDVVVVGEAEVAPGETDAWVARFSQADE